MTDDIAATSIVVVSTTTGTIDEARRIADALVEQRLAACVQITPIESVYSWEGRVQRDAEHLLQIKTVAARVPVVEAYIKSLNSYDLPEVLICPAIGGSSAYLDWIKANVEG